MGKTMLIDAAHREETRVVVLDQKGQIDEFDYETANNRQLKGNIYLAKITRVEPSLQAAFVEYGGNRHGFLAFSEIHPDYYQIPIADRQALMEIAAEERAESERLEAQDGVEPNGETETSSQPEQAEAVVSADPASAEEDAAIWKAAAERSGEPETCEDQGVWLSAFKRSTERGDLTEDFIEPEESEESERTEARPRKRRYAKRYKIQEVIKRRQVMLVQIVKEERGNKGAAVTTYLSLAGRYGVLMPNTNRGGGISRKIANVSDRKRLRSAVSELSVPDGMGLIIRTAGAERTKSEIKRDYEYLLRLWENVRELTLKSSAPTLVYEEGSLIKRSIRDLYNKDIDTIVVEGDEGYKEAKAFMRMLIPSHAKNVQPYRNPTPLYQRHQVESRLESMFNPTVQLKSGGYLVINPTEALISIDVNSGRATREHSIEDTALKTNLEAAEEAARQFRLRDLAGLIVIDFIDMEEHRNNRAVERKLKDSLKDDRARIQVGRISMFGLLEMSRQRMRAGLHESGTIECPHCAGIGRIRSIETTVLNCLRTIEEEGMRARTATATLKVPTQVGLYLLNNKRGELHRIEEHYSLHCDIELEQHMGPMESNFTRGESLTKDQVTAVETAIRFDGDYSETPSDDDDDVIDVVVEDVTAEVPADTPEAAEASEDKPKRRRRRRRGNGETADGDNRRDNEQVETSPTADAETDSVSPREAADDAVATTDDATDDEDKPRRRRRGRRGGRRNRRRTEGENTESTNGDEAVAQTPETVEAVAETGAQPEAEPEVAETVAVEAPEEVSEEVAPEIVADVVEPVASDAGETLLEERPAEERTAQVLFEAEPEVKEKPKANRRGWWKRG